MLDLVLGVGVTAFFAGIVSLIVRFSGREYAGQITTSLGNELDYDNPFPGWGAHLFGLNKVYEKKLDEPSVPFEEWPHSRSA